MSHVVAGRYNTAIDTGTGIATIANVQVGTGAGRAIQISFVRRSDRWTSVNSATIGGESMTLQGSDQTVPNDTNNSVRSACRINPTVEGAQTLAITFTGSNGSDCDVLVEVIDGIDTGQTAPTPVVATGTTATAAATVSSAVGRQIVFAAHMRCDDVGLDEAVPTDFTVPAENSNPAFGGGLGYVTGYAAGASSVTPQAVFRDSPDPVAGTNGWVAVATDWLPAAAGPTIDTQPTAQKVVRTNDTRTAATFTVAATTSGGTLTYQWQEEDSVAAGTYTNITTGGIYAGATSASGVITPTTNDENGLRYRCNVTDDNGTTTTDAVYLTVVTGPVASASSGSTNGSGVAAPTVTSDDPMDTVTGAFVRATWVVDGVTKYEAIRPATP